ncbi:hypothetical protein NQZ68_029160 [Dissostichus eleginoides]|nr:hypothetical protein NQZ68_029160 [Dissostichus eleginoides]
MDKVKQPRLAMCFSMVDFHEEMFAQSEIKQAAPEIITGYLTTQHTDEIWFVKMPKEPVTF